MAASRDFMEESFLAEEELSSMTARDLILSIASDTYKDKPEEQVQPYISALEDNMIDSAESMKELTEENYEDMGFPNTLVKKIKLRLKELSAEKQTVWFAWRTGVTEHKRREVLLRTNNNLKAVRSMLRLPDDHKFLYLDKEVLERHESRTTID